MQGLALVPYSERRIEELNHVHRRRADLPGRTCLEANNRDNASYTSHGQRQVIRTVSHSTSTMRRQRVAGLTHKPIELIPNDTLTFPAARLVFSF
jgi:hypothetical protein